MQVANVNTPITITGRHTSVTEAMREHAEQKVAGLHLDYPRIIEAKVILDVQKSHRHLAEIILHCANHITIQAHATTDNMYTSIDETAHKIARRMRKFKTRMLKSHRPHGKDLRHMGSEEWAAADAELDIPEAPESDGAEEDYETEFDAAFLVHRVVQKPKVIDKTQAVEELEMGNRPFVVYRSSNTDELKVMYRRQDGDYEAVVVEEDK